MVGRLVCVATMCDAAKPAVPEAFLGNTHRPPWGLLLCLNVNSSVPVCGSHANAVPSAAELDTAICVLSWRASAVPPPPPPPPPARRPRPPNMLTLRESCTLMRLQPMAFVTRANEWESPFERRPMCTNFGTDCLVVVAASTWVLVHRQLHQKRW